MRKWGKRCLALGVVAVFVWLGVSFVVASRLTRRPRPLFEEPAPNIAWGTVTPLRLTTTDGQQIGAWFFDGQANRPLVLLLHGNGGSRTAGLAEAEIAAASGSPVLALSLRAHGDSTGEVNDIGYSARHDVLAAVEWLTAHCPGRPIVVWGRSLGSAAALFAAAEVGDRVAGYILECPYQDLRTAVRNRTRMYLPWGVEAVAYAGLCVAASVALPEFDDISPLLAASRVPPLARVLILAGSADERARPEEAEAIRARIGNRAECVVVEGGDHLQLASPDPAAYRRLIIRELDRYSTCLTPP